MDFLDRENHPTRSWKVLQLKRNTHKYLLFTLSEEGLGKRAASDSTVFYCLQIHVTCSILEKPHLKGTGWSPDPAKRAFANPSPAGQASGRLWLQHLNNAIVPTDTARQKHTHIWGRPKHTTVDFVIHLSYLVPHTQRAETKSFWCLHRNTQRTKLLFNKCQCSFQKTRTMVSMICYRH